MIGGCVRDGDLLQATRFPVFAHSLCIRDTGKDFGARDWLNVLVMIGEVIVHPGDLVAGDADGIVAIPRARAREVLTASAEREAKEAEILARPRNGATALNLYGWNR